MFTGIIFVFLKLCWEWYMRTIENRSWRKLPNRHHKFSHSHNFGCSIIMPGHMCVCTRCSSILPDIETASLTLSSHTDTHTHRNRHVPARKIISTVAGQGEMINLLIMFLTLDEDESLYRQQSFSVGQTNSPFYEGKIFKPSCFPSSNIHYTSHPPLWPNHWMLPLITNQCYFDN